MVGATFHRGSIGSARTSSTPKTDASSSGVEVEV
jgi:hypothetical protein